MFQKHFEIASTNAVLGLVTDVHIEQNQLIFGSWGMNATIKHSILKFFKMEIIKPKVCRLMYTLYFSSFAGFVLFLCLLIYLF